MKLLASALVGTLSVLTATAATIATPSNFQDHIELLETVMDVGVHVQVNSERCDNKNLFGYYMSKGDGILVICQENRTPGKREMVTWTEEDLDTLLHESHHLIQDCRGGSGRGDGILVPIFENEMGIIRFARPILGDKGLETIAEMYGRIGAPWHIILLEFEAFAVAADIPASDIAEAVEHNCRNR